MFYYRIRDSTPMNAISEIQRDIERDAEIVELRAEVARLLGIIKGDGISEITDHLSRTLGLGHARAWLLASMYHLGGKTLTFERAMIGMPGYTEDGEDRSVNTLSVHICCLRKTLPDPGFIRTMKGRGYCISPEGLDWIKSLLNGQNSTEN